MSENNYQELIFTKKERETNKEFFERIGLQLSLLLAEEYVVVARYDEPELGIVVIEYEHDENFGALGCANPFWITEDEATIIKYNREDK